MGRRVMRNAESSGSPLLEFYRQQHERRASSPGRVHPLCPQGSAQARAPHPSGPPEGSTPGVGWGEAGDTLCWAGSGDRSGDVHPHSLARSLSPGTRCCPPGWAGRQGSCNREWVGGGTETPPRCPLAGREGCKGPCWPQWVPMEVSAVYTQEGRRELPLSWAAPGEREGRSRWHCHASHAAREGPRVRAGARLLLGAADDGEDVQEDVDDVRVQVQRCEHVLLRAQRQLLVPQQQLGVHCQELGRQQAVLRGPPSLPRAAPAGPHLRR